MQTCVPFDLDPKGVTDSRVLPAGADSVLTEATCAAAGDDRLVPMCSGRVAITGPRVVLLAQEGTSLADINLTPIQKLGIDVSAACFGPVPDFLSADVRQLRAVNPLQPVSARRLGAATKSAIVARRVGVRARSLWTIKSDRWAREALRKSDVVISADGASDQVLELVPDLLSHSTIVRSDDQRAIWSALSSLSDVLSLLDAQRPGRIVGARVNQRPLDTDVLEGIEATMAIPAQCELVPGALLPVDRVARTSRWLGSALGPEHAAHLLLRVMGQFNWESAPGEGYSGLAAQRAVAYLTSAADESQWPHAENLDKAVRTALEGADAAFEAGLRDLARGRLADAMALMFHRERHAETLHSPLVTDPKAFLRGLHASRTFRAIARGGGKRQSSASPRSEDQDRPRVLVLGGAYGDFHDPVVDALSDVATVTVRRPWQLNRFYARTTLDQQAIDVLGVLRGLGPSAETDGWAVRKLTRELRRRLLPHLRQSEVVFADWADRLTVIASHLVPEGCRLVVRIHSLDALDPWFHLVNWAAVDQVVVVSEPVRRLVSEMLEVADALVPVTTLANIAGLHEMNQPKEPGARTTLGMVGWGRKVKDPLWALDLLAREPSWRLVLIGRIDRGLSASTKAYHTEILRRLRDPAISDRVSVVGATDDVAGHLRQIGVILSTSRRESWHLGLVEGAASGAVPVVRNWPLFAPLGGAYSLFPADWVVESIEQAEARIREVTDPSRWEDERRRAQQEALALFDPDQTRQDYRRVVLGPLMPG